MVQDQLQRYFDDYTYLTKGHYPVSDLIVYWYMGEEWTQANKEEQFAISEGLLRSIEKEHFKLQQKDVVELFELYDLRKIAEQGKLPDEVMLQEEFTNIIEEHHLSH